MINDIAIQRSVIGQLSLRPEVVEVGPFIIGWDPGTDSRFINYATPQPNAAVSAADVSALVAAFRNIDRVPRLEYVVSCAPGLEKQMLAAGFRVEARHDYLVCSPGSLIKVAMPEGFEIVQPASDADLVGLVAAQNDAFGAGFHATPQDAARLRRTQRNGGVVLAVRSLADGAWVGGGVAGPPSAGVTEVTGIAVREAFRRRGVGAALTGAVTELAFEAGMHTAWLEASGEHSWRVYERVGYVPTGKRLYIALD